MVYFSLGGIFDFQLLASFCSLLTDLCVKLLCGGVAIFQLSTCWLDMAGVIYTPAPSGHFQTITQLILLAKFDTYGFVKPC